MNFAEMMDESLDAPVAAPAAPRQDMRGMLAPGKRKAYVLAGNATVTLRSTTTGARWTYKVQQSKPRPGFQPVWFVSVLNGQDNEGDYGYMGTLFAHGFRRTAKSRVSEQAPSFKAFAFFSQRWEDRRLEVWHEGVCGKCGRKLTVPESIESGLGPVCAEGGM